MKIIIRIVCALAFAWSVAGCTETLNDFNISAEKTRKDVLGQ